MPTKPNVMLAKSYNPRENYKGWYISEKLDGVRAFWDGDKMVTRAGHAIPIPDGMREELPPNHHLDGELYIGRGQFDETSGIIRRKTLVPYQWKYIRYKVFDMPYAGQFFWSRRQAFNSLLQDSSGTNKYHRVQPVTYCLCIDNSHLGDMLQAVVAAQGEGLMLIHPEAPYKWGPTRSNELLKVKPKNAVNATVIGSESGKGKHLGRLGALICRLGSGKKVKVGTGFSDHEREHPPVVGDVILIEYTELTKNGIPRFPRYAGTV